MKKINKNKLVSILKNKKNKTYRELAKITGYHEKSLIRLNNILKNNDYKLINKKRIPSRNTDSKLRDKIIDDYKNNNYKNYKEIYFKYKDLVSYSYICKLLNNIKLDKEILIVAKTNNYYIAIDYKYLVVLCKIPVSDSSINDVLLYIFTHYGIPSNIYFYNTKYNNYCLLKKYNINILNDLKIINKSIYCILNGNINVNNKIKYRKYKYEIDDFYNHTKRKVLKDNIIQFNNIRYKIISNKLIKYRDIVDIYYKEDMSDIYIKYNNKIYNLKKEKVVYSVKGLTKYK